MNPPTRKIIHCDCDCFYAAVEMRDNPALRLSPVAVGGRADQRGVIATCNYEARRYGIHSAMATAQAMQRCPDLVVLPPAMEKYRIASRQILAIYNDYTELVEPLSLDEAYLDVTDSPHCKGSATLIAQEIRARISETVGITASAGVAPNKFVAKIASDWHKPDGLFLVRPNEVDAFVAALPVKKLFGVGKVTAAKLNKLGAETCGDLRGWTLLELEHHFGRFGTRLFELCRGIDVRAVSNSQERKSVSVEETYTPDVPDLPACLALLPELMDNLLARIKRCGAERHVQKLFVKIRFSDFTTTTVECAGAAPHRGQFEKLMETGFARGRRAVRLLGVGVRLGESAALAQLSLFDEECAVSAH
ncbi:DNA polymerase IV [Massilia glaciei]|uniref:DNA polymerase IV n=1 Tax=Massilia glaciei TaxID=1524097 RepID=A0A2U2HPH4_9BURK|nr:DNA polymerase IV [Massilia glaciei]PWF49424.1 DNA polymerase IV [Massilia glaciei]